MNVLFVCTGNTCRSPMAEAIFNKLSLEKDKGHKSISRGISVFFPQTINNKSVIALKKLGIGDFTHKSSMISKEDVIENDLVLTMTSSHKMALKSSFPEFKDKIYSLNEKAFGKDSDIEDPFGKSQDDYNKCADEIFNAIERILCVI